MLKKFEKANRLQDSKKRTTPPGSPFFRTLRILRLRPQIKVEILRLRPPNSKNPKDLKKRMTRADCLIVKLATTDVVLCLLSNRKLQK